MGNSEIPWEILLDFFFGTSLQHAPIICPFEFDLSYSISDRSSPCLGKEDLDISEASHPPSSDGVSL